ncbi:MAG: hypothetical protein GC190_03880 [Alphaproteobacteria bacterium]|nr:hypothetical protein [Alphaproteobacteria bacterium]
MPALIRALLAALLLALGLPQAAGADAGNAAEVRASTAGGYGRIQFDWREKAQGKAVLNDGILVISFNQPFNVDTDALQRALNPLVALVRQDADGKSLRLALKGPIRLRTTDYGTRFAFDIVPPSFRGDPPPIAPLVQQDTQNGPFAVPIRVAEREHTTTVQFDWPVKVDYTAKMDDGKLTITFAKTANLDLKRFADSPPAWIRAARANAAHGKTTIEFDVDPEANFVDVSEGKRISFELREPVTDAAAVAASSTDQAAPAAVADGLPQLTAEIIKFPMPPRKEAPATPTPLAPTPATASTDAAAVAAAASAAPQATQEQVADGDPLPPGFRPAESEIIDALTPAATPSPVTPGKAKAEIYGSMLRLELPYTKLPAAAMFRRGIALWIVVETSEPMDLTALTTLPNAPARLLSPPSEVAPGITAIRLETSPSMTVSAEAAGESWVISIGPTVPSIPAQVQLIREIAVHASKLRALIPGVSQVAWVKDPQVGDRIAVILAYPPARGLADGQQFVEFNALPSMQGLAIESRADDLAITIAGNDAVVTRPNGLNLSAEQPATLAGTSMLGNGRSPAFVDFAAWGRAGDETHAEAARRLLRASALSPGGMSGPRMALARYYIAEGFGSEALGVLGLIASEDQTAAANPQFRVAHALANMLMGRYHEAIDDLSMDVLGLDPDAALWRGLAAAGARQWRQARSNLMTAQKIMGHYPARWRARAKVALARAALELGEPSSAMQAIATLPQAAVSADVAAEALLVRARLELLSNKAEVALALYQQVAASPYKPAAMRAVLEGTLLKQHLGKIKPEQAIDALERLRFQWRGDDIELKTLTELGNLYVAAGRYRDGLDTMRLAVRHFSQEDQARVTATKMAKIFEDLFLNGKADSMKPIEALGLFYDFRELTPVGAQGDEMIRKLADRLVSVDLLGSAAELLQHQVDQRLDGVAKASVAARLAVIYLMDRKPEKALDVIRSSKQTRLPDDLLAQRSLLEARALGDLKQYDQALELIATDDSAEAKRLRADLSWQAQHWADAGAQSEDLLGTRYEDTKPLTDDERMEVMRSAVAYSLAGDMSSLARLRTRFGTKMSASADARGFDVVTQGNDTTGVDYRTLVKRLAAVDVLEGFMADFHARYGSGGMSQPVAN